MPVYTVREQAGQGIHGKEKEGGRCEEGRRRDMAGGRRWRGDRDGGGVMRETVR